MISWLSAAAHNKSRFIADGNVASENKGGTLNSLLHPRGHYSHQNQNFASYWTSVFSVVWNSGDFVEHQQTPCFDVIFCLLLHLNIAAFSRQILGYSDCHLCYIVDMLHSLKRIKRKLDNLQRRMYIIHLQTNIGFFLSKVFRCIGLNHFTKMKRTEWRSCFLSRSESQSICQPKLLWLFILGKWFLYILV